MKLPRPTHPVFHVLSRRLSTSVVLFAVTLVLTACASEDTSEEDLTQALPILLSNFTDNYNGTVTQDINGSLFLWKKCAQGQVFDSATNNCAGTGGGTVYGAVSLTFCATLTGSYADCTNGDGADPTATSGPAFESCDGEDFASRSDWRLPTQGELSALSSYLNRETFLVTFPQTPDDKDFWSGSANSADTDGAEAFGVNFANDTFGTTNTLQKDSAQYVRCITSS